MSSPSDWNAWKEAAASPEADAALRAIYAQVDAAVRARGPKCDASGRCCKFNSYDHLLYVTGLEAAWFLRQAEAQRPKSDAGYEAQIKQLRLPVLSPRQLPDGCAWQVEGLCSAHTFRPLGCRVYFCEKGTEDWQQETYERFQAQLRALHDRLGLPYVYAEWRGLVMEGGR
jgi:Fe-S-cluster containining protein